MNRNTGDRHQMANIDYGMGTANIDTATGIRYGVISQHSMGDGFFDSWEAIYGDPSCPKCGGPAKDTATNDATYADQTDEYESGSGCSDYACDACRYVFDSSDAYLDEPVGFKLDEDGIRAIDCLDSNVMIIASPFYTFAPFCSPCVPGAGHLDNAETSTDGDMSSQWAKTYCFGHDWFTDGKAPYRVFRVADDTEVLPDSE